MKNALAALMLQKISLCVVFALAFSCGANHSEFLAQLDDEESQIVAPPTAEVTTALPSSGEVRVRAGALTVWLKPTLSVEPREGHNYWILKGRASRDLEEVFSFVFDDPLGEARVTGKRTFEIILGIDSEISTLMSGGSLYIRFITKTGQPKQYTANVRVSESFSVGKGSSQINLPRRIEPVFANGEAIQTLRFVAPISVDVSNCQLSSNNIIFEQVSARKFTAMWKFADFQSAANPPSLLTTISARCGSKNYAIQASIQTFISGLGLTLEDAETVWNSREVCQTQVNACLSKEMYASTFASCGSYRAVSECFRDYRQNTLQPIEVRAKTAIQNATGVAPFLWLQTFDVNHRNEKMSVGLVTGDEVSLELSSTGELLNSHFQVRADIVTSPIAEVRNKLVAIKGYEQASVYGLSASSAQRQLGRWVAAVKKTPKSSSFEMTLIELDGTRSLTILPFVYDEEAFRALAAQLVALHGLEMAANGGDIAELEVRLKVQNVLQNPSALVNVALADSPVGFDAKSEIQLGAYSVWGDNAIFVTLSTSTASLRVEDFN